MGFLVVKASLKTHFVATPPLSRHVRQVAWAGPQPPSLRESWPPPSLPTDLAAANLPGTVGRLGPSLPNPLALCPPGHSPAPFVCGPLGQADRLMGWQREAEAAVLALEAARPGTPPQSAAGFCHCRAV